MKIDKTYVPSLEDVKKAAKNLEDVAVITPLSYNIRYSKLYENQGRINNGGAY